MNKEILNQAVEEMVTKVWQNSPKMQDYIRKDTVNAVKTKGGHFIKVSKPTLEKRFCFASGDCMNMGHDEEMRKHAYEMCDKVRNDYTYFINENTHDFDRRIAELEEVLECGQKLYLYPNYTGTNICYYRTYDAILRGVEREENAVEVVEGTDIENIISMYKEEREKLIKRCQTYLKKYGTSKLKVWTYYRD